MVDVRSVIETISKAVPRVQKPVRKVSFGERILWTAIALTIFLMARKFTSTAQKRLKDLAETTLSLPEPLQLRQILLTGNDWILLAN
jgi:cell division protein FtsL